MLGGREVELKFGADADEVKQVGREIDDTIDDSKGAVGGWAKEWQVVMTAAATQGLQFAQQFGRAVVENIEMGLESLGEVETQLIRIQALGGATPQALEQMSDWARAFAVDTGQSVEELLFTIEELRSAQWEIPQAQELIEAASNIELLSGGTATLEESTMALSATMKMFGSQMRDASDAADFLRKIIDLGQMSTAEAARAVSELGGAASIAGVSAEEFGAIFGTVTAMQIDATRALPQLRQVMLKLYGPEAVKMAEKYGISLQGSVIDRLRQLSEADPTRAAQFMQKLAGAESIEAFEKLVSNFDLLSQNIQEVGDRASASTKNVDEADKSWDRLTKKLEAARGELQMMLAEEVVGGLKEFGEVLTALAKDMTATHSVIGSLISDMATWAKRIGAFAGHFMGLTGIIQAGHQALVGRATDMQALEAAEEELQARLDERIEQEKEITDVQDERSKALEDQAAAVAAAAAAETERLAKLEEAYGKVEKSIIGAMIKQQMAQADKMEEAQRKNAESTDDFADSMRRLRVELAATRIEQERGSQADEDRARHLDVYGQAVEEAGEFARMFAGVAAGAPRGVPAAAGPAQMLAELKALMPTLTEAEAGMVQPVLEQLKMMKPEESMMQQLKIVESIEKMREQQANIQRSTEKTSGAMDGVATQVAMIAKTPDEFNEVLGKLQGNLQTITSTVAERVSQIQQITDRFSTMTTTGK